MLDFAEDGRSVPAGVLTNEDVDVPHAERWLDVKPGHALGIRMNKLVGPGLGAGPGVAEG